MNAMLTTLLTVSPLILLMVVFSGAARSRLGQLRARQNHIRYQNFLREINDNYWTSELAAALYARMADTVVIAPRLPNDSNWHIAHRHNKLTQLLATCVQQKTSFSKFFNLWLQRPDFAFIDKSFDFTLNDPDMVCEVREVLYSIVQRSLDRRWKELSDESKREIYRVLASSSGTYTSGIHISVHSGQSFVSNNVEQCFAAERNGYGSITPWASAAKIMLCDGRPATSVGCGVGLFYWATQYMYIVKYIHHREIEALTTMDVLCNPKYN